MDPSKKTDYDNQNVVEMEPEQREARIEMALEEPPKRKRDGSRKIYRNREGKQPKIDKELGTTDRIHGATPRVKSNNNGKMTSLPVSRAEIAFEKTWSRNGITKIRRRGSQNGTAEQDSS